MSNPNHNTSNYYMENLRPVERFVQLADAILTADGETDDRFEDYNASFCNTTWESSRENRQYELSRCKLNDEESEYIIEVFTMKPDTSERKHLISYQVDENSIDSISMLETSLDDDDPMVLNANHTREALRIVSEYMPRLANHYLTTYVDEVFDQVAGAYMWSSTKLEGQLQRANKMRSEANRQKFGQLAINAAVDSYLQKTLSIERDAAKNIDLLDPEGQSQVIRAILDTPEPKDDNGFRVFDAAAITARGAERFSEGGTYLRDDLPSVRLGKQIETTVDTAIGKIAKFVLGNNRNSDHSIEQVERDIPEPAIDEKEFIQNLTIEMQQDPVLATRTNFDNGIIYRVEAIDDLSNDYSDENLMAVYNAQDKLYQAFFNCMRAILEDKTLGQIEKSSMITDLFIEAEQSQVQQLYRFLDKEMKYDPSQIHQHITELLENADANEFTQTVVGQFINDFKNDLEIILDKIN